MLNLLRRWYYARGREIFRYWDGRKQCRIDPVMVWRKLLAHPRFDLERDTTLLEVGLDSAWQNTLDATRDAFGVLTHAAGGLTERETVLLCQAFCVYALELKKNSSPLPTSSGFTGGTPDVPHSGMGQYWEDTPPPSASTSTSGEPSSGGQAA
jgi:hypothetical protein